MAKKLFADDILGFIKQGYTDADIIRYLREEGYNPKQINDAMNQAKIKLELEKTAGYEDGEQVEYEENAEEMHPSIMSQQGEYEVPVPREQETENEQGEGYSYPYPYAEPSVPSMPSTEATEELAEEIIKEKWSEFMRKVGDISEFRSYIETRLKTHAEKIKRLEKTLDRIRNETLDKVQEYDRYVKDLSANVQALEQAFKVILEPLANSVKEIQMIGDEMQSNKGMRRTAQKLSKVAEGLKGKAKSKTVKKTIKKKK